MICFTLVVVGFCACMLSRHGLPVYVFTWISGSFAYKCVPLDIIIWKIAFVLSFCYVFVHFVCVFTTIYVDKISFYAIAGLGKSKDIKKYFAQRVGGVRACSRDARSRTRRTLKKSPLIIVELIIVCFIKIVVSVF